MCSHILPPSAPGMNLRIRGCPTQGNNNRAAKRVDIATPIPICRNIIIATKVTTTEGISLVAKSVIVHNPPSLLFIILSPVIDAIEIIGENRMDRRE
jgi:hypothetical protein